MTQHERPSTEERHAAQQIAQRQRAAAVYTRRQGSRQRKPRTAKRQAQDDMAWYRLYLASEYPAPGFTG
jgi:hypothetical protein